MRQTTAVRVPDFPGTRNRDKGKIFKLTEWPAAKAENWALRMMLAANSGAGELPMNLAGVGMEGIAILGINTFLRGKLDAEKLIPLLDELLECVEYVRDPSHPGLASKIVSPDDVEEVATRMWLRGEVLTLHLNFSVSAALSALYKNIMTPPPQASSGATPPTDSPSQRTSPPG